MARPANNRHSRQRPPLDETLLERLALRYVERYATTRQKLRFYLKRKVAERGWAGADAGPDVDALAERLAQLNYIDDRGFAENKAAAMARRGFGERRVVAALRFAGIKPTDGEAVLPAIEARELTSALAYARRRHIGPYATASSDHTLRAKQIAAMARAGHSFDVARKIVSMDPGHDPEVPNKHD